MINSVYVKVIEAQDRRRGSAEVEAAAVEAQSSGDAVLIAHLRLEIARLTRTLYGQRPIRTQRSSTSISCSSRSWKPRRPPTFSRPRRPPPGR